MIFLFILMIFLPICWTQEEVSKVVLQEKENLNFKIDCRKTPHLPINALAKIKENTLLIFFNTSYVAVSEIQKDNFPLVKKILVTQTLIPRLIGHIEAAFIYENITYFLNNYTEMWNYDIKTKAFVGPYERLKKFGCLKNSYRIDSILTVQRSKYNAHMLIYHTENETQYLTFCDILSEKVLEKYQRSYKTDATEIIWNNEDKFQGISISGLFFSFFQISSYLGNLRYVPRIQPYSDNQLLLECPQQFCIDGKIDAILSLSSGITYLFRGKYFWQFPNNHINNLEFSYESVKLISDYWPHLPSNLDSAFCDSEWIYFFKDEKIWKYNNTMNEIKSLVFVSLIEREFPGISPNIDSIWLNKKDKQIYFIKGNNYYIFGTETKTILKIGEIIPILDNMNLFPSFVQINAIHEDNEENIYLFSNNYYFLANLTSLRTGDTLIAHLSQEFLFSCHKSYNYSEISLYKDFDGFKRSLLKYKPLNISFKPFANYSTEGITTEEISTQETSTQETLTEKISTESYNDLRLENKIEKWNQNVYNSVTSGKETPVSLIIFVLFTLSFIIITCIVAIVIIFGQTKRIYKFERNRS